MPRILKEADSNMPFHTPVYKWQKQTVEPAPSNIAATLGPRPGNTLKPPPNNFYLTKWTALDQRAEFAVEGKREFQFFSVENQVDEEPEVIAGIDLNEIIKKPTEKAPGSPSKAALGSPSKAPSSPSKAAPVSPSKAAPATGSMPVSPSKAPLSPSKAPASPSKASGSPQKPGSPPKPSAHSPKDAIMQPPSPSKSQK